MQGGDEAAAAIAEQVVVQRGQTATTIGEQAAVQGGETAAGIENRRRGNSSL